MPQRSSLGIFHCLIGVITFLLFGSCASTKIKVEKTPLGKYFMKNAVFSESHTGLLVYDPHEKKTVFSYNANKHFTPASNTKLLTFYAATRMLGDSIPAMDFCQKSDTFFIRGTGGPTLLYPPFEGTELLTFLKESGHPLAFVKRRMTGGRFGAGWSWDDYPYYYSPEKSAFPIYGNLAYFKKDSLHDFITVTPTLFEDSLTVRQVSTVDGYEINRSEFKNLFEIRFENTPFKMEDVAPFRYREELFIKMLSDTLQQPVILATSSPGCLWKKYYSVPTDSMLRQMLIVSDNFLAEQTLLLVSDGLGDTLSTKNTINFIMENYLSGLKDEIYWVDGSGLSRYNQITPHALVVVLQKLYDEQPKKKLFDMLPSTGKSGTLRGAFFNLEGRIHAKTGSMRHVYNLSGFLETNSGKILIFSFMNNNFDVSFSELKREMEKVLTGFVNYR